MSLTVQYYFAAQSPWAYLGHQRLRDMCRAAGASIELLPTDLGQVFPISGGLPLAKRAPQRQAYRLVELQRFSSHLGVPLTVQPKHFPVAGNDASRLIITVARDDGNEAALDFTAALMRALWVQERNIADAATLAALLAECGLPAQRLQAAQAAEVQQAYEAITQRAIAAQVFGSPAYVIAGEMFWGQDRLDFVERRLARG